MPDCLEVETKYGPIAPMVVLTVVRLNGAYKLHVIVYLGIPFPRSETVDIDEFLLAMARSARLQRIRGAIPCPNRGEGLSYPVLKMLQNVLYVKYIFDSKTADTSNCRRVPK